MKRKWKWLALPLVIALMIWGSKIGVEQWRAEHPAVTKWDSKVRARFAALAMIDVFRELKYQKVRGSEIVLVGEEMKPYIDCFHFSADQINSFQDTDRINTSGVLDFGRGVNIPRDRSGEETLVFNFYKSNAERVSPFSPAIAHSVHINIRNQKAMYTYQEIDVSYDFELHSITGRRWIELLMANPRIGPELKARLASSGDLSSP